MLRDPARFAAHHIGAAQRIKQAGLAVIDVAHDGHHWRPRLQRLIGVNVLRVIDIDIAFGHALDGVAKFLDQQFSGVLIDHVSHCGRHAHLEQRLDQVRALFGHPVGQFLHRDFLRHDHVAGLLFAWLAVPGKVCALFLLTRALERGEAARPCAFILVERLADGQLTGVAALLGGLVARVGGLLGRLGPLGRSDRGEPACGGSGSSSGGARGFIGRLGGGHIGSLRRSFGGGNRFRRSSSRNGRGGSNRGSGRRGATFRAATFFVQCGLALILLAAAGQLLRIHPRFFGLAQQAGLHFLARFGRRRGARGRRTRSFCDRSGRRRRGFGRSHWRFARLAQQLAALDLDHHLVGAAVAEGLLDLACLNRELKPQRLAAQRRFVVVAHTQSSPSKLKSPAGSAESARPASIFGSFV